MFSPTTQASVDRCSSVGHCERTPAHLSRSERTQEHWLAGSPMNSCAGGCRISPMAVSLPTSETQVRCRSDTSMWMICGQRKRCAHGMPKEGRDMTTPSSSLVSSRMNFDNPSCLGAAKLQVRNQHVDDLRAAQGTSCCAE